MRDTTSLRGAIIPESIVRNVAAREAERKLAMSVLSAESAARLNEKLVKANWTYDNYDYTSENWGTMVSQPTLLAIGKKWEVYVVYPAGSMPLYGPQGEERSHVG